MTIGNQIHDGIIRTHPFDDNPTMRPLYDCLLKFIESDQEAFNAAYDLIVTSQNLPDIPPVGYPVLVMLPWAGQEQPVTVLPAFKEIELRLKPENVIFTGGRTHKDWPLDKFEADILYRFVSKEFNFKATPHFERESTNTFEQFLKMAQMFPRIIAESQTIVILAHNIHTRRCLMTAREAIVYREGILSESEFERRILLRGYDAERPLLDPRVPAQLAESVAKIIVYGQKGHLRHNLYEAARIQEICTRAQEYALTTGYDRRIA